MASTITAVAAANSALAAIQRTLHKRRAPVALESPLFILGHWRSGTTFLHELLICDSRHSFANTYQCFAPHHFPLTERWLVPCIQALLPKHRPMDNMAAGWERPMEDEFALQNLGVPTPYISTMFPNRREVYPDYLTLRDLSPKQREQWKAALLGFCQRLARFDGRRLILKSPPHTARIRTLLELFPKAKFIHVSREPYALFRSSLDLWRTLNAEVGLQVVRKDEWLEDYVINTLRRMYDAYFDDRSLLPSRQLVEIKYEDLVRDPVPLLGEIYKRLELGDFSNAEIEVRRHLAEVGDYRRNSHPGDDRRCRGIDREWAEYSKYFGYSTQSSVQQAAA
jgi:omega-hydroxy-beta-dihydromenaquinone-9 sulfotransferase